nr:hypothetical protein [uncultured bacterium]
MIRFVALLVIGVLVSFDASAESVRIESAVASPQSAYAVRKLDEVLTRKQYAIVDAQGDFQIVLSIDDHLGAETFSIAPRSKEIAIRGGDARGLIYGALALAEDIENGTKLQNVKASREQPRLAFRAIKFNLPWDTYRSSSALDQHRDTCHDLKFWEAFLDMMVENRFNTITLWNLHPFTYMIQPTNFPKASPWTPEQFAEWQHLYRGIFRMAKERGLDTYIVFWSIFVSREFSENYGVAKQNFYPNYFVPGDTSEPVRRYLRESVTQVLNEYPDLDGIGVSHGEGMAGMTPAQRQQWVDDVLLAGALDAKRPVKLIHRVPFSSGLGSEPGVSKSVEEVTRTAMERLDHRFEGPIWVEMKFNWSHAHSTTKLVKVHGGKLGDTYFVPKPQNYKVVWMARNEDFFALRWGVPSFIREHIERNAAPDYVGGYFIGSETYIPALDYFTAKPGPVDWKWAFQRQWLFYKLWGRLLFDPKTPDSVFQADFNRRYGEKGNQLLKAYALASSTQLRLASLYDSTWDFTLYSEGFLALQGDTTKYISVDRLIEQPTLDPDYVSVREYVDAQRSKRGFAKDRITPLKLADLLERDCREALRIVSAIDPAENTSLEYELADAKTWSHLGLHLAEKLRGAVDLQTYRVAHDPARKAAAIKHLEQAVREWDEVIKITRPLYRNMPLTHYNGSAYVANPNNLFHWALIRDQVAQDVEIAKTSD